MDWFICGYSSVWQSVGAAKGITVGLVLGDGLLVGLLVGAKEGKNSQTEMHFLDSWWVHPLDSLFGPPWGQSLGQALVHQGVHL